MLIRDEAGLRLLREAQEEARWARRHPPTADFHTRKLSAAWARAAKSQAFRDIGAFSWDGFERLPVTPKDRLKQDPWSFAVGELAEAAKYYETTGTSGRVTPTPRHLEDIVWNTVSVAEAWRSVLNADDRVAILLPSDIVPVADLIVGVCEYLGLPHTRMYPFATGISDWDRLSDLWSTLRPTAVFAAPGVLMQLTRLLVQRGTLPGLSDSISRLMLLGEVSTPALRTRLGTWWDATAHDVSYGSTETGTLAATCPAGNLHLLTHAHYFELTDGERTTPLPADGAGRLVVTPLNLHARPLLRLDTGDEVEISSDRCDCATPGSTIVVRGRSSDGLRIRGADLAIRDVEEIVYGLTSATGYLVEVDEAGTQARLLLERVPGSDRASEAADADSVQEACRHRLGFAWDGVAFLNALPSTTKSGGSQKSWKRTNVRVVENAR
ncbi:phenylacetate--CoA ligase family protein [Streptomyces sp. NPDC005907]|uniref:phenylacetate--CoA ligase family protein n=1 Tax=Streptomyces sp. NPDC005907 TaxID=3154571 RepID=UPI0033FD3389